ncbi:MAG: hypothetical protein AAF086_00810 [Planctomycetota bacterium]
MNLLRQTRTAAPCCIVALTLLLAGCESARPAEDNPDAATAPSPVASPITSKTSAGNPEPVASKSNGSSNKANPKAPAVQDTTAPGPPPPGGNTTTGDYSPKQMQEAVRNFADLYRQTLASACDRIIIEADDDPDLRRRAQATKIHGATAMYDIAVDPVPASAMLNAAVTVSLQTNFLKANGQAYYGDYTPLLIEKSDYLQEEIFRICARVMSNEKRVELLNLINQWSTENPNVTDFWYIRLTDLPGVQQGLSVTDMVGNLTNLPSKFLNVFNPFSKGQDAVNEAQALAERMSWLGPRLMILAQWRAEAVVYDSIANTRLPEALELGDRFATVAESLPDTLDQQREALINDLKQNQETLNGLLNNTQTLAAEADQLFSTVDQIMARVETIHTNSLAAKANQPSKDPNALPEPPSRPFDITEYTAALVELNQVVTEANELFTNVDTAATPQALDDRLNVVETTVRNLILVAAIALLVVGLVIVLAVKFIPSRRRG